MSEKLYIALLCVFGEERLFELYLSRKNARVVVAEGAREFGRGHWPAMVALHTLFLFACAAEVLFAKRPFIPVLGFSALALELVAQALRYWAIFTLGPRWNARIFVLPAAAPVTKGPYRFVRHPNYVAVALDLVAVPLIHSAWITALVFTALNAWLLCVRIKAEEAALGPKYEEAFGARPRFVP